MMPCAAATGSMRETEDRICRFRPVSGGGFRAAVEITRRCNIACLHCFVPSERREPDLPALQAILATLGKAGCRKVILTGGEPLLRTDLEEIVRAAAENGLGADLNSNLVGLTPQRADALVAAGLGEASVSFYGDAAFHDAFVRRDGAYASTRRSCELLRQRGVDVDVHGPLWAANARFAEHVCDLAEALGAGSVTFFKVIGLSDAEGRSGFGATRFGTRADELAPIPPGELGGLMARLRARCPLPLCTVGFRGDRDAECEQGCSIVGLTADLRLSPCLLSRRLTPAPHQVSGGDVVEALDVLRREVRDGLWKPVCDDGQVPEGPEPGAEGRGDA